jgi:hypothetical protein
MLVLEQEFSLHLMFDKTLKLIGVLNIILSLLKPDATLVFIDIKK